MWGKNIVLYLENEPKYHFNIQNARNRRSKMVQNVEVGLTHVLKKRYVSSSIMGR